MIRLAFTGVEESRRGRKDGIAVMMVLELTVFSDRVGTWCI